MNPVNLISLDKLEKYKSGNLLFSRMENSTCTVEGKFKNVNHNEEDLMPQLKCTGNIVLIDSNFGHLKLEGYEIPVKIRKSNRGRKKKEKVKKNRKYQGDGSGFNSQITFTILGIVIRPTPFITDKHSKKAEKMDHDGISFEKFQKEYKIKVFRNGKITIPGVLLENLDDIQKPLKELENYFTGLFLKPVIVEEMFSVMRNYKFLVPGKRIDLKILNKYFIQKFQKLTNIRFLDIVKFILNPQLENINYKIIWSDLPYKPEQFRLSIPDLKYSLINSNIPKNLLINLNKLSDYLSEMSLEINYEKIYIFMEFIKNKSTNFKESTYCCILKYLLMDQLNLLEKKLTNSKNNMISYIKYDPEKYPGLLIKIKTPITKSPNKETTIKIFPSGKINIDGANNREEALNIYYWLNHVFHLNPEIVYE